MSCPAPFHPNHSSDALDGPRHYLLLTWNFLVMDSYVFAVRRMGSASVCTVPVFWASFRWSVPLALNESKRGTFSVFLPCLPGAANEKEANYLHKMDALFQWWQAFSALETAIFQIKTEEKGRGKGRWSAQNVTLQPAMRLVRLKAFTGNPV